MPARDFPSGPWTGFYNYRGGGDRHRMDLSLTFTNARIVGVGNDDVGRFCISGGYDAITGDCFWTKDYVGSHTVHYRGFREGKGIWGLWEIFFFTGGFHIWPLDEEHGETEQLAIEEPARVEVVREFLRVETSVLYRNQWRTLIIIPELYSDSFEDSSGFNGSF
jgi:hypothetical protein